MKLVMAGVLLLMLSCTERIDWEMKYQESDLIVVEGKITNERRAHEIKLTYPVYEMNGIPEPVSGAMVEISDGRELHELTEDPARPGTYLTSPGFAGEVNKGYQLRIYHTAGKITALTFMRSVTPFQHMSLRQVAYDPPLFEATISDSDKPAIVRLELDWSHVPGYDTLPAGENHAVIYHYTLNSVDVNRIFQPEREHVRFPPGTIVYREKESVNNFYEEFLRSMLSETDWRGGVFDVLPGNARTNMDHGAVGFFTAAEVIRDTVVIQ